MKRTQTATATFALLIGLSSTALADEAHLVPRVFGITPTNTATPATCPDLRAAGSVALLATPNVNGGTHVFADREANILKDGKGVVIIDLRNTVWDVSNAMHVTDNGIVRYSAWWQRPIDDPTAETPPGLVCRTGPDGYVFRQVNVLITQIDNGSDPDDGEYVVVESGGTRRFCIAFGLCNK